jgi:hypothetical protein
MRVEIRPVSRLRGDHPLDVAATLGPVLAALAAGPADMSRVMVSCDWIQYKSNFRDVADYRPILDRQPPARGAEGVAPADAGDGMEIAIDLRRAGETDMFAMTTRLLAQQQDPATAGRVPLEGWVPGRSSCVWQFNTLYWQALSYWEQATGREYEQALPGGESDARNTAAVRDLILELFKVWDDLDARDALPPELYVVELGVGNGNQAKTWLDEFVKLSAAHSRDYYRRLHYLMGDYSPHVLGRAMKAVAQHGDHITALVVDATRPTASLSFLRGKAFLVYISNVYDNLPTDEVARIGGRPYQVEVCAYLPGADAARIGQSFGVTADRMPDVVGKLLRLGPELLCEALPQHFADPAQAVTFWRDAWGAVRLAERYVPLPGLDAYQIADGLTGELLRTQLDAVGDLRMHVNNGALASFAHTLPLLHPFGRLQCHDLFLTDIRQYLTSFCGPGKYDGSVVNWVNGPLLRHVGNRAGFSVDIAPFSARPSSNVKTLTAQVRD